MDFSSNKIKILCGALVITAVPLTAWLGFSVVSSFMAFPGNSAYYQDSLDSEANVLASDSLDNSIIAPESFSVSLDEMAADPGVIAETSADSSAIDEMAADTGAIETNSSETAVETETSSASHETSLNYQDSLDSEANVLASDSLDNSIITPDSPSVSFDETSADSSAIDEIAADTGAIETNSSETAVETEPSSASYETSINEIIPEPIEYECPDGAAFRFVIEDVGINVACYNGNSQSIVDAEDSAAICITSTRKNIIADHNHQGFSAIKDCVVGTKAYLYCDCGCVLELVCTGVIAGHNTGTTLTDNDYNDITHLSPDGYICYTCNDCWQNVTIVFFEHATNHYCIEEY